MRCSLCFILTTGYKPLQDENGEYNDVYEITVKYFNPMLLTTSGKDPKILCPGCWVPIKDFSEFQQNVIRTRTLLEKADANPSPLVKLENAEEEHETTNPQNVDENIDSNDMNLEDVGISNFSYESVNVKPDLDLEADSNEQWSTSDKDDNDEVPLFVLKNKILHQPEILPFEKQEETTATEGSRKPEQPNKKSEDEHNTDDVHEGCTQRKNNNISDDSDDLIAEWKPVLECDLCEETASNYNKIREHFKEKHDTKFYITCCERKFYYRHSLVNHIRLHLNPEIHKCDICGKVSTRKSNLEIHKKMVHVKSENAECEICHKLFRKKAYLDKHLLTHATGEKSFACQECDKAYMFEVQLKDHIRTIHNVDRICGQCGKTIHGRYAMKKHLMEHSGITQEKYPCDICGVELCSRKSVKRHKDVYHQDGSTIYICSICGKVAASAKALLTHKEQVHFKERKYKCTYCDKAFKIPRSLREHIATHTGKDLYQCPDCPKTFKVRSNMNTHRKRAHPIEWEENRKNRSEKPIIDINHAKNQVVL